MYVEAIVEVEKRDYCALNYNLIYSSFPLKLSTYLITNALTSWESFGLLEANLRMHGIRSEENLV